MVRHAEQLLAEPEPVTVPGIDETRRGRPVWVQNPDTGRWALTERFETSSVDLAGDQGLLGQTAGRTSKAVTVWLDELGQDWKDAVQILAMDPCASYRANVSQALPNTLIVVDHLNLVRLAKQALTDVRRHVTWEATAGAGARPTRPGPLAGG